MTSAARRSRRRPIRSMLLVLIGLLVLAAAAAPGLLGLASHQRLDAALAEHWPSATVRWQRGWFASRVEAADADAHLVLDLAHPPADLNALLTATGRWTLARPDARIDLDGRLGWSFDVAIDARTEALVRPDLVTVSTGPVSLALALGRDGAADLRLEARAVRLERDGGAQLSLDPVTLTASTDGRDPARVEFDLLGTRTGAPAPGRLRLLAHGIDPERAAAWQEALAAAIAAAPGTTGASLAWIGVASAWEQLARAGLVLALDPLDLENRGRFEGRWEPGRNALRLAGQSPIDVLERWVVPIAALVTGDRDEALEQEFLLQLETFGQQPGVRIDTGRLIVDWPADPVR